MNNIKKIVIKGFRKFKNFSLDFNDKNNIIIGDNESGKSTLLEAIDLVLNKRYSNFDKYIIREIINNDLKDDFVIEKKYELLPKIEIFLFLNLDNTCRNNYEYKGEIYFEGKKIEDYGIKYTCEFNTDFRGELMSSILEGKIPYEYYDMKWETFRGDPYNILRKPLKYLSIDNSKIDSSNSFNHYNKNLFFGKYDSQNRMRINNLFRDSINNLLKDIGAEDLDEDTKFGIDNRKTILENIINIVENGVPLENKGKGRENLIKTNIALNKNEKEFNVIAIEEPENHLSHINLRKMIEHIKKAANTTTQIIITTHNSLIVNTLNLSNLIWINENGSQNLATLQSSKEGKKAIKFFEKADNLNLLQFILSPKVILVEGPTEYMMLQNCYIKELRKLFPNEDDFNYNLEIDGIEIISCGGDGFDSYITIAKTLNKKVAIITDNDYLTNNNKIAEIKEFNNENDNIKKFTDSDTNNWTWEVSLYNLNTELLENTIKLKEGYKYEYKCSGKIYSGCLGKMLNQKTETAYLLSDESIDLVYPDYIKECIEWIRS